MTERQCTVDDCERPLAGRGWCKKHWERWKRTGDPLGSTARHLSTECSVVEDGDRCGQPTVGRGWCRKHYMRWRRHGDPLVIAKRVELFTHNDLDRMVMA